MIRPKPLNLGASSLAGVLTCLLLTYGRLAPAQSASTPAISIELTTTTGATLKLPDPVRPTALLFLLPGQPAGARTLADFRECINRAGPPGSVQVILVVVGSDWKQEAQSLQDRKVPFPVVSDPQHQICERFNVHAYPTTAVLTKEGVVVGHLAGSPKDYSVELDAYLAFASGRIDRAGLDQRLRSGNVAVDSPAQMAQRHLQIARRLLGQGLIEQARVELLKAQAIHATDTTTQVLLAEALIDAGDTAAATAALSQVDASTGGPKVGVLRARILIAQDKWSDARDLLTKAIALNPDPAEAYYFLGRVYQHDGEADKAADAYRKAFESTDAGRRLGLSVPSAPTQNP
jgi:tetratricopeptide (TPR) repeat protein